jgi:hypothetical protein
MSERLRALRNPCEIPYFRQHLLWLNECTVTGFRQWFVLLLSYCKATMKSKKLRGRSEWLAKRAGATFPRAVEVLAGMGFARGGHS